jgi:hypothetical protein
VAGADEKTPDAGAQAAAAPGSAVPPAAAPPSLQPSTASSPGNSAPVPPPPGEPAAPAFDLSRFIKFDGQIRFRYEYFDPFAYTAAGVDQSDDAVFMRTRLGFLFTLHQKVAARFQLQDSRIWGEEGANSATAPVSSATASIDNVDIHQAYVDLKGLLESWAGSDTLSMRIGRQELSYGDQRLVSPLDWSNIARAWDAAKVTIDPATAPGGFKVDLFASIIRDTTSSNVGGGPVGVTEVDQKQGFHGIYASFEDLRPAASWTRTDAGGKDLAVLGKHQLDLYGFYRDLSDGVFTAEDGSTGDVDEGTLGTRFTGKALETGEGGGFDYTGEIAYQLGDFAGDDLSAYGYAVMGGYTFAGESLGGARFRLGLEYDYGSGDSDPADGDRGTFDPLFPFGHYYQGIQDTFSWKNGQDLAFKLDVYPPKSTRVPHAELQYHFFWLSEERDGWFNAGLAQIRRDPTGASGDYVGMELDVTFKYALVESIVVLWIGYAHFFPGEFVRNTGDDPDRDFVFAQMLVNF